jgi:hypothetical protein
LSVVACAGLTCVAAAAHAAPQTSVALEYDVGADGGGCPSADEFAANVARQLGYDPFSADADRRVAVQIARKETGFDGRIRWTDADGRWVGDRHLTSRSPECRGIGASLAFSVAVQIQLLAVLAAPAAAPAPPQPAATPPPPEPRPEIVAPVIVVPPPPPPAPAEQVTLSVGLGPALALGVAPRATGLARLFVSGRLARLSLEVGLDASWPATRQQVDGSGFALDRFAAGAAGCGHAGALAGCFTVTAGVLQARGTGVDAPATARGWFSQVGARIAATRELGRFFASARVDGLVMLSPWTVTLNDIPAWTTPRVAALIAADLGVSF